MTRLIAVCKFSPSDAAEQEVRQSYGEAKFKAASKTYEYLAPEGATGQEKFAVVCPSNDGVSMRELKIVRIVEFREATRQQYEGGIKPVLALIDTDAYTTYIAREAERKSLLARIEKKVAERSKISQLELLAGDDEEARALLEAYKAIGA